MGERTLPVDPAPGFGGILLGGIVAAFIPGLDPDLHPDLERLTLELEAGRRIAQPRLRYRYQVDRIGLTRSRHRLLAVGERMELDLDDRATPGQYILGAVYAAGQLPFPARAAVMEAVRRGMHWRGTVGPALISVLSGARTWRAEAFDDPLRWALGILDLTTDGNGGRPSRLEVQRRFRQLLRQAHPDHGAAPAGAAERIAELAEARRILSS